MTLDLILLAVVHLALALYCLKIYRKLYPRNLLHPVTEPFVVLALVFFLEFIIEMTVAVGVLDPLELSLVHSILFLPMAVVLAILVMRLTNHSDLKILLGVYILGLILVGLRFSNPVLDTQFLSLFFMTVIFLHLELFPQRHLSRAGQFGVAYAGLGALLTLGGLMDRGILAVLVSLPLLGFLYLLEKGLERSHATLVSEPIVHFSVLRFARFLGFIATFYLFISFAAIGFHEMGHALAGRYQGCEFSKAVIYDVQDRPHTEIYCSGPYNDTLLSMGGLIFTTIVGLLLLAAGGGFLRSLSFYILGFGFLISFADFSEIALPAGVLAVVHLVAIALMVVSLVETTLEFRRGVRDVDEHFDLVWRSAEQGDQEKEKGVQ